MMAMTAFLVSVRSSKQCVAMVTDYYCLSQKSGQIFGIFFMDMKSADSNGAKLETKTAPNRLSMMKG